MKVLGFWASGFGFEGLGLGALGSGLWIYSFTL